MNGVVTSSIRLDVKEEAKIGPASFTADLSSRSIRIFVDNGSLEKAKAMAMNSSTRQLETFDLGKSITASFISVSSSIDALFVPGL